MFLLYTRDAARQDVFGYIEMFYNPTRKHTHNDMPSPVDDEIKQRRLAPMKLMCFQPAMFTPAPILAKTQAEEEYTVGNLWPGRIRADEWAARTCHPSLIRAPLLYLQKVVV